MPKASSVMYNVTQWSYFLYMVIYKNMYGITPQLDARGPQSYFHVTAPVKVFTYRVFPLQFGGRMRWTLLP